jgi:pilus assembly protein CpaB
MKRPVVFVALAGLAAMLASVVVYNALKKREAEVQRAMAKTVYIVVAATDMPLGSKIDPGQLKLARWSADAIPDGAFTNPGQVAGAFVKNQFVTNEPIVATKLFLGQKTAGVMPLLIPPGMRAVSVPVDEVSDISGFILPHARVDILVAVANQGGGHGDQPFSKIVLQNVEVLAVAQEVENKKDEPELVKVVTVLVTPQDAERLALATREGVLHLAMRNYSDNKIVLTSGTDVEGLLHQYSIVGAPVIPVQHAQPAAVTYRPPPKFQVQIYRDGKSSESVSFVREALANTGRHHSAEPPPAAGEGFAAVDDDQSADQGAMNEPTPGKDDGIVSHASNSHGPTLPPSETVPDDQSASFAPKGKTIDIP